MLSCIAGEVSSPGLPLSDMVIRLARAIARKLMAASARREKVSVVNPIFPNDQFTDRWPENRGSRTTMPRSSPNSRTVWSTSSGTVRALRTPKIG